MVSAMNKMSNKISIQSYCEACGGTGLYSGMYEGPGEAVVCIPCGGTGCEELSIKRFAGRKRRPNGIQDIRVSEVGGKGKVMTYKEFKERYPEPSIWGAD